MDLSLLKDNLSDFATFGKNVGAAFQGIPNLLTSIVSFFDNFGTLTDTTGENFEAFSSASEAEA